MAVAGNLLNAVAAIFGWTLLALALFCAAVALLILLGGRPTALKTGGEAALVRPRVSGLKTNSHSKSSVRTRGRKVL